MGMRYIGLEIVRLKRDHPDEGLKAGDCGVVWGVYGREPDGPFLYEANFFNERGEAIEMMFEEEDVETVDDVAQTPHPDRLLDWQRAFHQASKSKLRESGGP
jgi:hypothetical protein